MLNFDIIQSYLGQLAQQQGVSSEDAPVFFFGLTGAGKSTLVNYLSGWNMYVTEDGDIKSVESSVPMEMSSAIESLTVFPRLQRGIDGTLYCDCPGINDNRGPESQLCTSIAIERAVKMAKHIAGIVVIIDYSSFSAARGQKFRELFDALNARLCMNEKRAASVVYLFNKVPERFSKSIILKKLHDLSEVYDNPLLKYMLMNENNVWIVDPCDKGKSRTEIMRCIRSVSPLTMDAFNVEYHDPLRDEMRNLLDRIVLQGLEEISLCERLPSDIENLKQRYLELEEEIKNKLLERQKIYEICSNKLQADVLIPEMNRIIDKNTSELNAKITKKTELEKQYLDLTSEFDSLNSEEPVMFWEKIHEKSAPLLNPDGIGVSVFDAVIDSTIGMVLPVSGVVSKSITLVNLLSSLREEQTVSFDYRGPSIVSISKEMIGVVVKEESINQHAGHFSMTFVGNENENQRVAVKIFIEKKRDPKNIQKMEMLTEQKATLLKEIQFLEVNIVFLTDALSLRQHNLQQLFKLTQHQDESLPSLILQYVETLQQKQLQVYQDRRIQEKRLMDTQEKLRRERHIYELTVELLTLLSGIEKTTEMTEKFIAIFSPVQQPVSSEKIEKTKSKESISALQEEVALLNKKVESLETTVEALGEQVRSLITALSSQKTDKLHSPSFFSREFK